MSTICRGPAQYCFNDDIYLWYPSYIVLSASITEQDVLTLQFWPVDEQCNSESETDEQCNSESESDETTDVVNEASVGARTETSPLFEVRVNTKACVVGVRTAKHFMNNAVAGDMTELHFIATSEYIVNLKGEEAAIFIWHIQFKRCIHESELGHDIRSCKLDKVFYVCTDIGEVDEDETEFLLAVTPSDISVISLHRSCVTRTLPVTKIRTYSRAHFDPNTVKLEMGRMQHGNRVYSFRSRRAGEIIVALKEQISAIAVLIGARRNMFLENKAVVTPSVVEPAGGASQSHTMIGDHPSSSSVTGDYERPNSFEYENFESKPTSEVDYENPGQSGHTSAESAVVEYALPISDSSSGSWSESTEFSTSFSEIYPFVGSSFDSTDNDCLYEKLSTRSEHYSPQESDVIYQEVDLRCLDRKRSGKISARRRSRSNSKPTFISYIVGGTEALLAASQTFTSCTPELYLEPESVNLVTTTSYHGSLDSVNLEGSGVYCKLYDPRLLDQGPAASDQGQSETVTVYDTLVHVRDFKSKSG